MNRTRKRFSLTLVLALTFALLLGGSGLVYAQEQIVTMGDPLTVAKNATFDVTFTYNVSDADNTLGALGFAICYDSTKVSYVQGSYVSLSPNAEAFRQPPALIGSLGAAVDDTKNIGEFGATSGKLLPIMYGAPDGKFPNTTLPLQLFKITFAALNVDASTSIKIKQVATATGYTIPDSAVAVTVGTAIVPTPMDIPAAVLAIEATDPLTTVIDANAAEYVNEHITGAITADADLPADKATRILVYGRDAAAALAFATSLVDQDYTNVAYLDDIFANFAADITKVTDAMVQYKLTVNTVGAVAVAGNSPDGFHNRNAEVNLEATPATVTWSGNAPNGVVTMNAPKTVTATFAGAVNNPPVADPLSFTTEYNTQWSEKPLTGSDPDNGDTYTFIKVSDPLHGSPIEIDPNTGAFIYNPNDGYSGPDSFTFKVKDSKGLESVEAATVTITVKPPVIGPYTLTVNATAGGTAVKVPDQATYTANTVVTITATPAPSGLYRFVNWTGDAVDNATEKITTVTMNANKTVTANFELIPTECDLTSAVINASTYGGVEPLNVALSAAVTGTADTYSWTVTKDGISVQTGSAATLNLTGLAAGNYTVYLIVSNSALQNCSRDAEVQIQVSQGGDCTKIGDGNNDGEVDIFDALLAAIHAVGNTDVVIECLTMLDVYEDAGVTTIDALKIAMYDVRLSPCDCSLDPY